MTNRSPDTAANVSDSDKPLNYYLSIFILTLATFMASLDSSVANVALPKMAGDLSVTPSEMVWVIGSYLVATAAILPISGWLATYLGRKRYYMISVLVFTISSVLCGLATNLETLVFFRVIQGLSGGGLASSEQAIIADITPKDKLGRAFSIYAFGVAAAPVFGPTLGGFITDTLSWHWVFFINLPIGIISLVLTWLFVEESKKAKEDRAKFLREGKTVDWLGILLFVGGIAALELFLEKGPKEGWLESNLVVLLAVAAFFALSIGITWELYQDKPAVDITMFKNRNFAGACILIFTVSFVLAGSGFLIPFMTQTLLGYTAMSAGMISLPGTILQMIGINVVGYLSDKFDVRKIIMLGLITSALAMWNYTTFNLDVDFYTLATARALQIASLCFLAVTINTAAYYDITPEKNNSASALLNLARNMGSSFGIALTSTVIALQTQVHTANLSSHASAFNQNFTQMIAGLTKTFQERGMSAADAASAAYAVVWDNISRQASMKAILDALDIYLILYLCLIPLVFLLKRKPASD